MTMQNNDTKIKSLLTPFLNEITPLDSELLHFNKIIQYIMKILFNSKIPEIITIKYIEPEGSTGIKQTALRNAADIDIFIGLDPNIILKQKFSSKKDRKEYIRQFLKKITTQWIIPCLKSKNIEDIHLSYAEHPYVSAKLENIDLDIVICFDLTADYIEKNGPITAVDRTPHHSRFIRDNLSFHQKNDVRLLKHFFQSNYCYGDKSPIGRSGFIGYSAELLIEYYGTIGDLFRNFYKLNKKVIYSKKIKQNKINNYFEKSFEKVKRIFFQNDYLIIIDPIDPRRNVGSSISPRAYHFMNNQISTFLKVPNLNLFLKQEISIFQNIAISPQLLKHYFYIEFKQENIDHYTKFRDKIYRLLDKIIQHGKNENTLYPRFGEINGELLFNSISGQYALSLYVEKLELENVYLRKGPKVHKEPYYTKFLEKHPDAYEKDNHLYIEIVRSFRLFEPFLIDFLQKNQIDNLKIVDVGSAEKRKISKIASQSITNLHLHILPYIHK